MKIAVLLGNKMKDDGFLSDLGKLRLAILEKADGAFSFDKIILAGGLANEKAGITEAVAMQNYFKGNEKFLNRIILEDNSLTTKENAQYSAKIIKDFAPCEVVVITSLEHMSRPFLNPIKLFQDELAGIEGVKLSVYSSEI